MILEFEKEGEQWFVVLPDWKGSKAELQMVAGADTMLEYMASGGNKVTLSLYENTIKKGYDVLEFVKEATELGNGAHYILKKYRGIEFNLEVWLCDVTKFVFGKFPKRIYICSLTE